VTNASNKESQLPHVGIIENMAVVAQIRSVFVVADIHTDVVIAR
jgi:hypothetical protein